MKVSSVRIDLDRSGVGGVLRSSGVQADLDRRGRAVQSAAEGFGIMVEGEPGDVPLPITVSSAGTSNRARTIVAIDHWSGLNVEAKHRLLVGCLDAAR